MGYHKRYEDSYLDKDDEADAADDRSLGEKIVSLLEKPERSEQENERLLKLHERLFMAARLPATPGALAVVDITLVSLKYVELGDIRAAVELWDRLSGIAEANGDKDLYYRSMEEMAQLS